MKTLSLQLSVLMILIISGCCSLGGKSDCECNDEIPVCQCNPDAPECKNWCAETLDSCGFAEILAPWGENRVPGQALLVMDSLGEVWQGTVGNSTLDVPLTTDMLFFLPLSPFVTTIVLKLVEEGKIGLDDPVSQYLPAPITNFNGDMTIRQTLNNQSGVVFDGGAFTEALGADRSATWSILENSSSYYLESAAIPGEDCAFSYINSAIIVPGILEEVTGKDFGQLVSEYITTPLNMTNTFIENYDTYDENRLAHIWVDGTDETELDRTSYVTAFRYVASTLQEYADFYTTLHTAGGIFEGALFDELIGISCSDENDTFGFNSTRFGGGISTYHMPYFSQAIGFYHEGSKHTVIVVSQGSGFDDHVNYFTQIAGKVKARYY